MLSESEKHVVDTAIVAGGFTHRFWVDWLANGDPVAVSLTLWLGVLLIVCRLVIAYRSIKRTA